MKIVKYPKVLKKAIIFGIITDAILVGTSTALVNIPLLVAFSIFSLSSIVASGVAILFIRAIEGEKIRNPFRKKPFNAQEELQKISNIIDEAWSKYEKNPNWRNAMYLEGVLDITEKFINNVSSVTSYNQTVKENKK